MRKCLLTVLMLSYGVIVNAQAFVSSVTIKKVNQAAVAIRLSYAEDAVKDALKDIMMRKGYKNSSGNGFMIFRGVMLDGTASDLYCKTDLADRKEKDVSILYCMPVRPGQEKNDRTLADSGRLDPARLFLDSLAPFIIEYDRQVQVKERSDGLSKAQRKLNDLRSDSADLEKKLRSLQSDLADNKRDQVKASASLHESVKSDDDSKAKDQKKMNKLMDKEAGLQKKIRSTQQDLDETKDKLVRQQALVDQQQQGLDAVKVK